MKRFVALFVILLCLISCKSNQSSKSNLVIAINNSPQTFDPRLATDAYAMKIKHLLFNGLLKLDNNLELTPDVAEKYEMLSPTEFKFYLKKGILFHDDTELKSDDVIYTYESIMDSKLGSPFKGDVSKIDKMEKVDDYTVVFKLKESFAPIVMIFTHGIVPKKYAAKDGFGRKPIGTGPYKFVQYRLDERLELAAFDKYFRGRPKTNNMTFRVVKDDNVRVMELIRGNIDLTINGIPYLLLSRVREEKNMDMLVNDGLMYYFLSVNLNDPILKNQKVRQAIAYAINRDEVIEYKLKGLAEKADSMLSPRHWAHAGGLTDYKYDPKKAAELLDEAGFKDPDGDGPEMRFKISIKTTTNNERLEIMSLIAEHLKKVGIDAKVLSFEWGTYYRDVKSGNFQLASSSWVGLTEPDMYYSVFHSTQVPPDGANRGYYSNARIDILTEEARREYNQSTRKKLYGEIQEVIQQDLPYISLWHEKNVVVFDKKVKNISILPNASYYGLVGVYKD